MVEPTLSELSERATPGPWGRDGRWAIKSPAHGGHHTVCRLDSQWGASQHGYDAAFIVACVNTVRRLLSTEAGRTMLEGEAK